MISSKRVLTIVNKDMAWAKGNLKLLAIMILPLFAVVFFSRFDSAATFNFSLIFVNAFIGIFSTSYLVIEEKNKGTLLALLTSPLTGGELLLGKFLFNLILCSFFSLIVILFNGRFDLFLHPLALLNVFLFAGTTCFIGFVTGVYFKNEQEMSVLAPVLMVLFCFGDALEKVSDKSYVHAFFPDYQIVQSVKDVPISLSTLMLSNFFSILMFLVAYLMASFYTQFYFSNNREKRFSWGLMGFIGLFVAVLMGSGLTTYFRSQNQDFLEKDFYQFSTPFVSVQFSYDKSLYKRKTMIQSKAKTVELLTPLKEKNISIVAAIRDLEEDESTLEKRAEKFSKDLRKTFISKEEIRVGEKIFTQWVYTRTGLFVVLRESFCGKQIFQYSLDLKLAHMKTLAKRMKSYQKIFDTIDLQCLPGNG